MKRSDMPPGKPLIYPYIPNSAPTAKEAMLREVGARTLTSSIATSLSPCA